MKQKQRKRIVDRHRDSLTRYGYHPHALYWSSREIQETRFEVLAGIGIQGGESVLDVGCGFADFKSWFENRHGEIDYTGLDLSPDLLAEAAKRHPDAAFVCGDLFDLHVHDACFDWVILSGALNEALNDNGTYACRVIERMYRLCRKGVAFNLLDARRVQAHDLQSFIPDTMLAWCSTLCPHCKLREDYLPEDFSIYMRRLGRKANAGFPRQRPAGSVRHQDKQTGWSMKDKEAIQHLQQSGHYMVIERLEPRDRYWDGAPTEARIGVVVDIEATGLDTRRDKIIEVGLVAFEYDAVTGMVYRVLHRYGGFEDPREPLNDVIRQITGISDDMLVGQRLDDDEISTWLDKADLVVAHNAAFDRQMLERRLPAARRANWACTMNDIDWPAEDIGSLKLDYIAFRLGYCFTAHRAINDAEATLHLLTRHLPASGRLAMVPLLESALLPSRRYFAEFAPFEKKDLLRERGYRWLPEFAYGPAGGRKTGVWSRSVAEAEWVAEESWLNEAIYAPRAARFSHRDVTAEERYSLREFASA